MFRILTSSLAVACFLGAPTASTAEGDAGTYAGDGYLSPHARLNQQIGQGVPITDIFVSVKDGNVAAWNRHFSSHQRVEQQLADVDRAPRAMIAAVPVDRLNSKGHPTLRSF